MKIDMKGMGVADIRRVAIVGPTETPGGDYREARAALDHAASLLPGEIEFAVYRWVRGDTHRRLRRMVRDLSQEWSDGRPCVDAVCALPGWDRDGTSAFAAAVASTCGAPAMGLDEWLAALAPGRASE